MAGLVYLIQNGDEPQFKIGLTRKPEAETRKKALSTGNPNPLRVIDTIETEYPKECEKFLHKHLASRKITGGHAQEFFAISLEEVKPYFEKARIYVGEIATLKPEVDRLKEATSTDEMKNAGNEDVSIAQRMRELRQQQEMGELELDLLEAKLKIRIGDAAGIDGVVTWKTVQGTTFDSAAFKEAHADLYATFCKPTESRRFKLI